MYPPPTLKAETIDVWLEQFLPKLKRTTTRTQKCRLILAVERMDFKNKDNGFHWKYLQYLKDFPRLVRWLDFFGFGQRYGRELVCVRDRSKRELEEIEINDFMKMILDENQSLLEEARNEPFISRWQIKPEDGQWKKNGHLDIITTGGEAIVINEKIESYDTAVRVQVFDPFLFTEKLKQENITWQIHVAKGIRR